MRAAILAGGRGTRLFPYTKETPKPLLTLSARPILEILLHQLNRDGFRKVSLCLGHQHQAFDKFFHERKGFLPPNMEIETVVEPFPLGTAGALKAVDHENEDILVLNGDVLTDMDFGRFYHWHKGKGGTLSIAAQQYRSRLQVGVLEIGGDNDVTGYVEKPRVEKTVSMGVYAFRPRVFKYIDHNEHLDFPELAIRLIEIGESVKAYNSGDRWVHIGTPEQYAKAQRIFHEHEKSFVAYKE